MKKYGILTAILLCVSLTGCAVRPTDPEELAIFRANNDPMEPLNRGTFAFNRLFDKYLFRPVTKVYHFIVPDFMRTGFYNFSKNLRQPVFMTNALLQGEPGQAADAGKRFLTNTFWGFLGTIDVAGDMQMAVANNDFGQTLGVWGVGPGPYFVIPFLGPSNIRDTGGYVVDLVVNPANLATDKIWPGLLYSRWTLEEIDARDRADEFLQNLEKSSTDYYVTTRTMFQQNRAAKVARNRRSAVGDEPEKKTYEFDFNIDEE